MTTGEWFVFALIVLALVGLLILDVEHRIRRWAHDRFFPRGPEAETCRLYSRTKRLDPDCWGDGNHLCRSCASYAPEPMPQFGPIGGEGE